jgi:hypothetical protein
MRSKWKDIIIEIGRISQSLGIVWETRSNLIGNHRLLGIITPSEAHNKAQCLTHNKWMKTHSKFILWAQKKQLIIRFLAREVRPRQRHQIRKLGLARIHKNLNNINFQHKKTTYLRGITKEFQYLLWHPNSCLRWVKNALIIFRQVIHIKMISMVKTPVFTEITKALRH